MHSHDPGKTPGTGQHRRAVDRTATSVSRLHPEVGQSAVDNVSRGPGRPLEALLIKDILALQSSAGNAAVSGMLEQARHQHDARPAGKTIIQRMYDKDGHTQLNDLNSLNTTLRKLTPEITGVSVDMFETPGVSRLFLDQAITQNNTALYDSMKRGEILEALRPGLAQLVDSHPATLTYDTHGNKHFPGPLAGTKFTDTAAVVNPVLMGLITPLVGWIRRDARGANATYYLTQAGITQCPRDYPDLTIQIDFNYASDEITYHGYPDKNVAAYSLSRSKGGQDIR